MPYAVPLIRASEMRTMSVTPFRKSFGEAAYCRPPPSRDSLAAAILENHHAALINIERFVVDAGMKVFHRIEHHGTPAVLQEMRAGGGQLDHGAVGARFPRNTVIPAFSLKGAAKG